MVAITSKVMHLVWKCLLIPMGERARVADTPHHRRSQLRLVTMESGKSRRLKDKQGMLVTRRKTVA